MQAVSGYLYNGLFRPYDGATLPRHARVRLVIEEIMDEASEKPDATEMLPFKMSEAERQAKLDGIRQVEKLLEFSRDEDLSDFPKQGLMKVSYDDWLD